MLSQRNEGTKNISIYNNNIYNRLLLVTLFLSFLLSSFRNNNAYASGEAKDVTNGVLTIKKDNNNNEDNTEEGVKVNITYKADGIEETEIRGYNEETQQRDKPIYLSQEIIDSLFNTVEGEDKTEVNLSFNYLVNGKAITAAENINTLANKNILFTGTNTRIEIGEGTNLNIGSTNQENNSMFGMIGIDLTESNVLFKSEGQ